MVRYFVLLFVVLVSSCEVVVPYKTVQGKTMGTTYSVTYQGGLDYRSTIDSLLLEINQEVSTYIPDSDIGLFNSSDRSFELNQDAHHFRRNWEKAVAVSEATGGFFDPTVMPLINYWGFGYDPKVARTNVDSIKVDSLMMSVGMDKIIVDGHSYVKENAAVELDFSAIAKGYAVDMVGDLLDESGVEHYFVEIGGEVVCKGKNKHGGKWRIGINKPLDNAALNDFELILNLSNVGLASSGNYRNFYLVGGKKYGHTIDPKSGYPVINELLGVAVVAPNCMTADAYATSFMAMGLDRAIEVVESDADLEACFFTSNNKGTIEKRYTNGFIQYLQGE